MFGDGYARAREVRHRCTRVDAQGPAHERRFTCAALIDGEQLGTGTGTTKKDAEQEAAREALQAVTG